MFSTAKKRSTLLENKGIEYLPVYSGSLATTRQLLACSLSRNSVLQSTRPSCLACRTTRASLKTVWRCVRRCSSAARQDSRRPTPTQNTSIDG